MSSSDLTVATPSLRNGRNHGVIPSHAVSIATLALVAGCASPTEPQARGCTLTQPLAMPAGWTAALSQHFDACPAAPGAQSLGAYVVRWD